MHSFIHLLRKDILGFFWILLPYLEPLESSSITANLSHQELYENLG
jgi:hypothetical protein